jgi:hypothetical protein
MLLIYIPQPNPYYCQLDENHFFSWLKSIDAIKSIELYSEGINLTINTPIDKSSFYDLVGLMRRYRLDMRTLKVLCEDHPDPWFRNKKMYWYKYVFK